MVNVDAELSFPLLEMIRYCSVQYTQHLNHPDVGKGKAGLINFVDRKISELGRGERKTQRGVSFCPLHAGRENVENVSRDSIYIIKIGTRTIKKHCNRDKHPILFVA